MARSEDIARLIPLYRQFIATQRALAQQQADKLRPRPGAAAPALPETDDAAPAAAAAADNEEDTNTDAAAAAKETPIEPDTN